MQEEIFRALESGATLITASQRLARVLTNGFHARQRERGRLVWNRPDILPLDGFLDRAWRKQLWRGGAGLTLLQPLLEQTLWEQVVRDSPAGDSLLQIPETARSAMDAWRLVQAYRLPMDGRFEASEDGEAFRGWARDFEKLCAANRWLERARLSDFVVDRIASGEIQRPAEAYRAGFDELTPQQSHCFAALANALEIEIPGFEPSIEQYQLPDRTDEIRRAAAWARSLVERDAETQIGIIVPNLEQLRPKLERVFQATLNPAGEFSDPERYFHLSLGPRLVQHALVRTALLMLEFGLGELALPRVGMLLRSPFLAGAEAEWSGRARIDAKLRREGVWDLSVSELRAAAGSCPRLEESLRRFEKALGVMSTERRPSEWTALFSKLFEAFGWPGDRPLNTREFQLVRTWRELLSDFAALDRVVPLLTFKAAFHRLREAASSTVFQVENEGANVQIMGMFEASGLRFDHLWIMGLDDETLPAASNPNPFLPLSLQQECGLPHASPERELDFASGLIQRLTHSAPDVVISYPERDGDRLLTPSPLVPGDWHSPAVDATPSEQWIASMRASVRLEELADEHAPPVLATPTTQPGGSSLFKDMAACPFRAFAKHRLNAKPLEETRLGLSYRDHGAGVHKALELIWRELGSQARLAAMETVELQRLVARSVTQAMTKLPRNIGQEIEQRRLEKLLTEWLAIEKTRAPFVVRKVEQERLASVGGLQVKTRADRVDELPDGREIILDYKTGQVKSGAWDSDRPDEPQIPLYCATNDQSAAGAAMAVIRTGELGFRGLTDSGVTLPAMKDMKMSERVSFHEQVARWRSVLENLAENFQAGRAEVDPKEHACENCGLWALCRIREFENDRG